jgi:hypothetical protein
MKPRLIFQTGLCCLRPRKKSPAAAGDIYAKYIRRMPDARQPLVTATYTKVGLIPKASRALPLELFTRSLEILFFYGYYVFVLNYISSKKY